MWQASTEGIYQCPLYLYPIRTGTRERPSFMIWVDLRRETVDGRRSLEIWDLRSCLQDIPFWAVRCERVFLLQTFGLSASRLRGLICKAMEKAWKGRLILHGLQEKPRGDHRCCSCFLYKWFVSSHRDPPSTGLATLPRINGLSAAQLCCSLLHG